MSFTKKTTDKINFLRFLKEQNDRLKELEESYNKDVALIKRQMEDGYKSYMKHNPDENKGCGGEPHDVG